MGRIDSSGSRRRRLILAIGKQDLAAALPMGATIEAMKTAFAAHAERRAVMPHRAALVTGEGTTLVMPAFVPPDSLATKIVSVVPGNRDRGLPVINGLVIAFDPATGVPLAILDGAELTARRTGAASGAATDLLARPEARIGAVIGCGAQGVTQLLAIDAVRDLDVVRVFCRDRDWRGAFAEKMDPRVSARVVASDSAREAVRGADIVCTATDATEPVFEIGAVSPGAHINAVGSFKPGMRELGDDLVARARVFVDSVADALEEAGELLHALAAGVTDSRCWIEIGAVVNGSAEGRTGAEEITIFKSVGLAVQDAVAADLAYRRAREAGLGSEVSL